MEGKRNIEIYFEDNIDELLKLAKEINNGWDNERYEIARKWLFDNGCIKMYELLSREAILCEVNDEENDEKNDIQIKLIFDASKEGCFVIGKSSLMIVKEGKMDRDIHITDYKLYKKLDDFFEKIEMPREENMFLCEDGSYAFCLGKTIIAHDKEGNKIKRDSNCNKLQTLIGKWVNKKTNWQEKIEFKDYLQTAVLLKTLIPPSFVRDNKIITRGVNDYKLACIIIDKYLKEHYKNHAKEKEDLEKLNEERQFCDFNLSHFKWLLVTITNDEEFGMDFVNSMTTLKGIDEEKYKEIMIRIYNVLFYEISTITKRLKYLVDECLERREYLNLICNFEYEVYRTLNENNW